MVANSIRLRQMNEELVRSALKSMESGTKNTIAAATGLSVATCGNILQDLMMTGEVLEAAPAESTGGRPSRRFLYNPDFANAALMYVRREGRENSLFCCSVNMAGSVVHEEKRVCEDITPNEISNAFSELMHNYPRTKVLSVGIPGVVHDGTIGICDFPELQHVPLRARLENTFHLDVLVENDVNSTALGYYQSKLNRPAESVVYIYYPGGGNAGAGIIINGKVLRGNTDFAGEVSFLPLGVDVNEQGNIQKDTGRFADLVTRTILSVNALINPETIVISGSRFTEDFRALLNELVSEYAVSGHVPLLVFEQDIHESYIEGLKFLAIKKMSCEFEIIKK